MAAHQTFTNTFVGGMANTVDGNLQSNSTFRYAIGGRLTYNRLTDPNKSFEQNIKEGVSLAFVVAKGNKFELAVCGGYKFIGSIDTSLGTVMFLTNGIHSEIGLFTLNDNVYAADRNDYVVLYNDLNDPNGDKLNFSEQNYIHGFFVDENEFAKRIYWVDGVNQKRTLNIVQCYKANGEPYHTLNAQCNQIVQYPKHLSVHAMDIRMDLTFPKIKFNRRVPGQLKSGTYQLIVRYGSDTGHSSVWFTYSKRIFVTNQKIDGDIETYTEAYKKNHHNRTMGVSNTMTEEGLEFILTSPDQRWDHIEIGYIYNATDVMFEEANSFKKIPLVGNEDLIVTLDKHSGSTLTQGEINQRFETILTVGTTAQQENRTWDGNITLQGEIKFDISNASIKPKTRYYNPDVTLEPTFQHIYNPVSGRYDGDPLTNTFPVTANLLMQNFTDNSEAYTISDDYFNYKGQQFENLFKGYFRGETYPFALVVIDRKGNPLFAQHIQDYTFPNMYDTKDSEGNDTDWTLTRKNTATGLYDIRVMGAAISGIKIPHNIVYDKFGKLNISGFMIVRAERIKRISCQGILVNATFSDNAGTDTESDRWVHPMISWDNYFAYKATGNYIPGAMTYSSEFVWGTNYKSDDKKSDSSSDYSAPYFFNFHSPDILIEGLISEKQKQGRLKKVGIVHRGYTAKRMNLENNTHLYTKNYKTIPLDSALEKERIANGRPKLGSYSRIVLTLLHTGTSTEKYLKFDPETSDVFDYRVNVQAITKDSDAELKATQQPGSVIIKLKDWPAIDTVEEQTSTSSFAIVNWEVSPDSQTEDSSDLSLDNRRYFSTNHYQPITESVLSSVKKTFNPDGSIEAYEFNDIEVWGGDCYANLFDFTRLYPEYSGCNNPADYSISHILPIESKYNLALLFGRRFAANAVLPQSTSCWNQNERFLNGIQPKQPEDWSYNKVLLVNETTRYYVPKPADLKIVSHKPVGVWWSPKKIYGELEDSFRQSLVSDYSDLDGQYGEIQKFAQAFSDIYVVQSKAFGAMRTSLQSFVQTDSGDDIYVKSGDVFGGVRYISKKYGSQHKNSIWSDGGDLIGFADSRMGKLMVFSQAGLSAESESDSIDDPVAEITMYMDKDILHDQDNGKFIDIITGFDNENSEILTTVHRKTDIAPTGGSYDRQNEVGSYTFIYSRLSGKFHGYSPLTPYIYINTGRYLLTPNTEPTLGHRLYLCNHGLYGKYYEKFHKTILEFYVTPQSNVNKRFDNGFINVNHDGYGRIEKIVHEVDGNIHEVLMAVKSGNAIVRPDNRAVYKGALLRYPMRENDWENSKPKMTGNYLKVTVYIDNEQQDLDGKDTPVVITSIDTKYRMVNPIQY